MENNTVKYNREIVMPLSPELVPSEGLWHATAMGWRRPNEVWQGQMQSPAAGVDNPRQLHTGLH